VVSRIQTTTAQESSLRRCCILKKIREGLHIHGEVGYQRLGAGSGDREPPVSIRKNGQRSDLRWA
jgi:hypothetical protein